MPTALFHRRWFVPLCLATVLVGTPHAAAQPRGACCCGSTCVVTPVTACNTTISHFAGTGTTCNPAGDNTIPCCKADFNHQNGVTVQDIFDFLTAWFAGSACADFNGGGHTVQDIFDFLASWFAGCP